MIIYIYGVETHSTALKLAKESIDSFQSYGYEVEFVSAYTEHSFCENDMAKNAALNRKVDAQGNLLVESKRRRLCNTQNQMNLWRKVADTNETAVFAEYDSLCIGKLLVPENGEVIYYGAQDKVPRMDTFWHFPFFGSQAPGKYYLRVPILSLRIPQIMINGLETKLPNTICYSITPIAARKLLKSAEEHGVDSGEWMINTGVVDISYVIPAPIAYNTNLHLTDGVQPLVT